jgi:hypothetical protein
MKVDRSSELFQMLIGQLAQSGWASLGKIPNPMTGEIDRNLEIARLTIDTLEALETRTKGNLTDEESTTFDRLLRELRMNYLDEIKKEREGPKAEGETQDPEESKSQGETEPRAESEGITESDVEAGNETEDPTPQKPSA